MTPLNKTWAKSRITLLLRTNPHLQLKGILALAVKVSVSMYEPTPNTRLRLMNAYRKTVFLSAVTHHDP